jgi:hypothetical protein
MSLTPGIALWRFGNPLGFELPKWEFTCECEGSFLCTLFHSREHEMWLPGLVLARTFANPCLGHEPKARVATKLMTWIMILTNKTTSSYWHITCHVVIMRDWVIISRKGGWFLQLINYSRKTMTSQDISMAFATT